MDPTAKLKIFVIAGTRPELIKMYPIYKALYERTLSDSSPGTKVKHSLEVKWISSSQHVEMLEDLYQFFKIRPDHEFDLNDLNDDQDTHLAKLASRIINEASELFAREQPDLVIVQGDTLTAQQCALAAFYQRIRIAHVEAGIRTNNIYSPFPEELARRTLSQIADLNFAPSTTALNTLEAEKIMFKKQSYNFHTGNPVVYTLEYTRAKISDLNFNWGDFAYTMPAFTDNGQWFDLIKHLDSCNKKIILITAHRRENLAEAHYNLANAIYRILEREDSVEFIVSVHKNPEARKAFQGLHQRLIEENLKHRVHFFEAINYPLFVKLMIHSYFIVTDSGGIQEEAPYLGKPVLVFRNETERVEGMHHGMARLIGTEEHMIHGSMLELIVDPTSYNSMIQEGLQPYGDGLAASRIADLSLLYLKDHG